ncbi:hypothetical protein HN803_08680 [candidate division WWE3 bacterium]|jgi:hypothetical protein|nr:hypothetical protein [candidate division WWE3 bacterium]
MNDKLQAIFDSHINGQGRQMVEQINGYGSMYDVFHDLRGFLQDLYVKAGDTVLSDIVVKYHRINYK